MKKTAVSEILQRAKQELLNPQAYQEACWILSKITNKKTQTLFMEKTQISSQEEELFWNHIEKRKNHYPLDYLLGESCFLDHKFFVEEGVFIPRLDTEVLVKKVFSLFPKEKALTFMDLGSGAGTISLSLLFHFEKAKAIAVELNTKALACLKKNSELMGLHERVFPLKTDILALQKEELFSQDSFCPEINKKSWNKMTDKEKGKESIRNVWDENTEMENSTTNGLNKNTENKKAENGNKNNCDKINREQKTTAKKNSKIKLDFIVANPPYIDPEDNQIEKSVYLYEPPLALFADQEGMGSIYTWFDKAMDFLDQGACYLFEFGWNQSKLVKSFLDSQSSIKSYEILKDSLGYNRVALVFKK